MLIAGPVCLLLTPPFQVADESNHFMRAIQISQNQPIAITRTPNEKGAFVPDTVIPFVAVFSPMMFAPEKKLTPHMLTALQSAR
ncbi:hypothetical protein AA21952_3223 [Acetobacter oeni LMG 21952]|nr:hypothetical protein AA21952_3223 [Acetobacter oeni LMG 21952]